MSFESVMWMSRAARGRVERALDEGDWVQLDDDLDWIALMRACAQDPTHHPEGDVLAHTQMVCEQLDGTASRPLRWAAKLHDVGKIITSREEQGHIRAPHHAEVGSRMARLLLWRLGWPWTEREHVARLVRNHMRPPFLAQQLDEVQAARIACDLAVGGAIWSELLALSAADASGRGPTMPAHAQVEELELLGMWLGEHGMLDGPPTFASSESRLRSLTGSWQPHVASPDPSGARLVIMSGLPASGKSTHAGALDMQVVSLDELRTRLDGHGRQLSGRVRQAAGAAIRTALAAGESCCLDATGLTRQARSPWLRLGREYGALVEIHCIETDVEQLLARNRARSGRARVPDGVLASMAASWQMPSPDEAHEIRVTQQA